MRGWSVPVVFPKVPAGAISIEAKRPTSSGPPLSTRFAANQRATLPVAQAGTDGSPGGQRMNSRAWPSVRKAIAGLSPLSNRSDDQRPALPRLPKRVEALRFAPLQVPLPDVLHARYANSRKLTLEKYVPAKVKPKGSNSSQAVETAGLP